MSRHHFRDSEFEATDLAGKFSRIAELLHRYRYGRCRDHGPMGDPHRGQGRVLALLKMRPEISQRDLSYLLDIRQQSLAELLAKLERVGYIERSASEGDRRMVDIRLTEEGMKAAEQSPEHGCMFKSLSQEEQESLHTSLDKIIAELEEIQEKCRPMEDGPKGHGKCHRHDRSTEWHSRRGRFDEPRSGSRHRHDPEDGQCGKNAEERRRCHGEESAQEERQDIERHCRHPHGHGNW